MGDTQTHIMGLFTSEDQAVAAITGLQDTPYRFQRAHSPIPSHKIMEALKLKTSKVGLFTLVNSPMM
jgi:molybdopterin-containing oxidoreductase family membrane subunit